MICNLIQARNPTGQGERAEHPAGRRGVRLRVLAAARGGIQARHPPSHGSGARFLLSVQTVPSGLKRGF